MDSDDEPNEVNPEEERAIPNRGPEPEGEFIPDEKNECKPVVKFLLEREYCSNRSAVKTLKANFVSDTFCQKDIREHTGCINAVTFSHKETLLATGGDDSHTRIWSVDELMLRKEPKPISICEKGHQSNIFSLEFDLEDRFVYSGERYGTIFKHDISTNQHIFTSRSNIPRGDAYNLDHHPFDNHQIVVAHCKEISFLDDRDPMNPIHFRGNMEDGGGDFYSAEFHPVSPVLLLINSETGGPAVFDRRNPETALYSSEKFQGFIPNNNSGYMGAKWSPSGNQYMVIRRKLCPLYFDLVSQRCFKLQSAEDPLKYRNTKTVKSMTFIDDYTVATGSDQWGIHFWKAPRADETAGFLEVDRNNDRKELVVEKEIRVLHGHRSIPNQVRYSNHNKLFVSSGVENSFKLWSHCRLPWSYDVPFKRQKRGDYDHPVEVECIRERAERRVLENEWEDRGMMEGRASWDDVFGGNEATAENRETLEMFDRIQQHDSGTSDEDDDDDEDGGGRFGQWQFLIREGGEEVLVRRQIAARRDFIAQLYHRRRMMEERGRREAQQRVVIPDWFDDDSSDDDDEAPIRINRALYPWNQLFADRESSGDEEQDDEEHEGVEVNADEEEGGEQEEYEENGEHEEMEDESESDSDSETGLDVNIPVNEENEDEEEMDDEEDPED